MNDSFIQSESIEMIKDALTKWAKSEKSDEPGYVVNVQITKIDSIVINANPKCCEN